MILRPIAKKVSTDPTPTVIPTVRGISLNHSIIDGQRRQ